MMEEMYYFGVLIRLERMKQKREQREVSYGICVPSYLCKIEKCKVCPDEELVSKLLKKLGITYYNEPEMLDECNNLLQQYWQCLKYATEKEEIYNSLKKKKNYLMYSKLAIEFRLIEAMEEEGDYQDLEPFFEIMNDRQQGIYCLLQGLESPLEERIPLLEKAYDKLKESFVLIRIMECYLELGEYGKIQHMETKCINQALEEGCVYSLISCYFFIGTAYACLNLEEMMISYYNRSIQLAKNTIWEHIITFIYYNMGAVFLCLKQYEEGIGYLKKAKQFYELKIDGCNKELEQDQTNYLERDFYINQKLALAYIRKGEKEKSRCYIECMKTYVNQKEREIDNKECMEQIILEEVCMELREDYREEYESLLLMEQLLDRLKKDMHFGYVYFYKDVLLDIYCGQRKYKKALEFEREISGKIKKLVF